MYPEPIAILCALGTPNLSPFSRLAGRHVAAECVCGRWVCAAFNSPPISGPSGPKWGEGGQGGWGAWGLGDLGDEGGEGAGRKCRLLPGCVSGCLPACGCLLLCVWLLMWLSACMWGCLCVWLLQWLSACICACLWLAGWLPVQAGTFWGVLGHPGMLLSLVKVSIGHPSVMDGDD
jgi:hypothetical protein